MNELFKKDINRSINGVIKAGQLAAKDKQQELEEYIITRELNRYFDKFFYAYVAALDEPTDKIGVWISGFFGSGKSHFLKILSYLLDNSPVHGKTPLDYFESKVTDPSLLAALGRAAAIPKDVILFNIDSKASMTSRGREAIVETFQKVFNEHLGYLASSPSIADIERMLDKQGNYQSFQAAYREQTEKDWFTDRELWSFREDEIVAALIASTGLSESAARNLYNKHEQSYSLSVNQFAHTIKDWLDSQSAEHQLIFMVDEVGQYIGENGDLMLNLQTIAEDLGSICPGRAWIIVTSQEDIDSITQHRVRGNDFSKIQGRFKHRPSLSSSHTDEVIKLRLLEKTDEAKQKLEQLYHQHEQALRSLIRFSQGTSDMPGYKNEDDFALSYPFIPYQFKLLQRVFTAIRLNSASGKHLSQGERSMLDAFQLAAQALESQRLGALSPFYAFYQAIEGFLDGAIKLVITQAADILSPFETNVLKTLFMIKYVKEIKGTTENLTTLSISHIEEDRLALSEKITAALNRLEAETLIQRNGDVYEFLTHEEQDIDREIKNFTVQPGEVTQQLHKILWEQIFPDKQFRLDAKHDYKFDKMLDGRIYSTQNDELALSVITPENDNYADFKDDATTALGTGTGKAVIVRLPDAGSQEVFRELRRYVQTERFVKLKRGEGLSPSLRTILEARAQQNTEREKRVREGFERLIVAADVFVHGVKLEPKASNPKDVFNAGLKALVEGAFNKLNYVKSHFDKSEQTSILLQRGKMAVQPDTQGNLPNALAHNDMLRWLQDQQDRHQTVTLRAFEEHFSRRPYGWSRDDIFGLLAELLVHSKVELRRNQATVDPKEDDLLRKMTSRQGLDQHILRVPRAVNPEALRLARELLKELGDLTPSSDAQEVFLSFQERLKTRQDYISGHLKQAQTGHYPFVAELEGFQGLIKRLLASNSTANFFETLKQHEDDFEELIDRSPVIEGFFKTQITAFDAARKKLESLQADLKYVRDNALQAKVKEIEAILKLPDPSKEIPRLSELFAPVEAYINQQIEMCRAEAQQIWQQTFEANDSFAKEVGLAAADIQALLKPLSELLPDIDQANSIDSAMARIVTIETVGRQVNQAIIDHNNQRVTQQSPSDSSTQSEPANVPEATSGSEPASHTAATPVVTTPKAPAPRPIKNIRPASLSSKNLLENKDDIDAYLRALEEQLLAAYSEGYRLRIE